MQKKILAAPIAAVVSIVLAAIFLGMETKEVAKEPEVIPNLVSITVSSSRPGCEESNTCYFPYEIVIYQGESVTWKNDDSAFHTVTSGYYDEPDGMFDSGQLDAAETFSRKFEEGGFYDYYCRLHPWMKGTVVVKFT
ncbi:MAG: plastocyanin/azurin family copper-binding protein [Candidatus Nitrosotenuis sp.]